jgi:ferrous-iron efflux pump FieF
MRHVRQLASVTLAVVLLVGKAWAAYATNSTAMLGSLADTALDVIASITTLVGVRIAAVPADTDHRFGHGKAEALVALAQVGHDQRVRNRHRLACRRPPDQWR